MVEKEKDIVPRLEALMSGDYDNPLVWVDEAEAAIPDARDEIERLRTELVYMTAAHKAAREAHAESSKAQMRNVLGQSVKVPPKKPA